MASWLRSANPILIAHRGLPTEAPEQTIPSFEAAIAAGAECIEADAQLTADGHLVMLHDISVERTTDGTGTVSDLRLDDVRALDAGSSFAPQFRGVRVPLATELLALAADHGVGLCLEAKGATPEAAARVAVALAKLVRSVDALEWAFVSSFHHTALAAARRAVPGVLLAPERLPERGPQAADEVVRQARELGCEVIQHRWELITAEVVDALHADGVGIWAWNTNDDRSVEIALALGVDGLIADDVGALRRSRDAYANRRGVETPVA